MMQKVIDCIYEEIDELFKMAETLHRVWMRNVAKREVERDYSDRNNIERTGYQLRVEPNGISFRIRWYEVRFVKRGEKLIRLTKSMAIPESGKYNRGQFKKASEWELSLITTIEDGMSDIRYKLKHLGKAHSSAVWASKRDEHKVQTKQLIERVERSTETIKSIKDSLKK